MITTSMLYHRLLCTKLISWYDYCRYSNHILRETGPSDRNPLPTATIVDNSMDMRKSGLQDGNMRQKRM